MASRSIHPKYNLEEEEEEDISTGPINMCEAPDYAEKLGTIFDEFDTLVRVGDKDALIKMLQALKDHTANTWDQTGSAETKMVLASINEPSCDTLRETLVERVITAEPEEDLPTGQEILQKVLTQTPTVREHCISLFDDLAAATSYLSSAYGRLSALAKACDEQSFRIILNTSARPLVQVNILPNFLNPIIEEKPVLEGEEYRNKLRQMLLPQERNSSLRKEARNNATRLLAALVYIKFKKCYLNEGTEPEMAEKFDVKPKVLSKLISGHRYWGGKDKKPPTKRKAQPEKRRHPPRKSLKSSTAVKPPESDDDKDDGD